MVNGSNWVQQTCTAILSEYAFDKLGNVTSKSSGATTWTYTYDLNNQMTQAKSGSTTVNYAFDAMGNRISRTQGSSVQKFAYDGWDTALPDAAGSENFNAVADLDNANNVTARRMFGPDFDFMGARVDGAGTSWYLTDPLGSVRAVTNSTGVVTGTQTFDAYCKTTATTGSGLDRYGYTGRDSSRIVKPPENYFTHFFVCNFFHSSLLHLANHSISIKYESKEFNLFAESLRNHGEIDIWPGSDQNT